MAKYIRAFQELAAGLVILVGLWAFFSSKPIFECLSETGVFVNYLPWILFAIGLALHYSANRPNLNAELKAVIDAARTSQFVYTAAALLFLMLFCKGCSSDTKIAGLTGALNLATNSGAVFPRNDADATIYKYIMKMDDLKRDNDCWGLAYCGNDAGYHHLHETAIAFFQLAEACAPASKKENKLAWRTFRPGYARDLFFCHDVGGATNQLEIFYNDCQLAWSNQDTPLARAMLSNGELGAYAKASLEDMENEILESFPEEYRAYVKPFRRRLDALSLKFQK